MVGSKRTYPTAGIIASVATRERQFTPWTFSLSLEY